MDSPKLPQNASFSAGQKLNVLIHLVTSYRFLPSQFQHLSWSFQRSKFMWIFSDLQHFAPMWETIMQSG